jgi:hypothetical protein
MTLSRYRLGVSDICIMKQPEIEFFVEDVRMWAGAVEAAAHF